MQDARRHTIPLDKLADLFRALTTPTKIKILRYLIETDPDTPCVPTLIASHLGIRPSTVSSALNRMRTAGIINRVHTGRYMFYSVDQQSLDIMREYLS